MPRHAANGVEVSNPHHKKAPKVESVPTHVHVQSPSVGGVSKAAVRAVVGTKMMSHDPSQVQGVDLGLSGRATLNEWRVYFDSVASCCAFFNADLLEDIKEGRTTMVGSCNVGTTRTSKKGMFGPMSVWYNPSGANLLSIPVLME